MELKKIAVCGTMESSDIMITISPSDTLTIELSSTVEKQFGEDIRNMITKTLNDLDIKTAHIKAVDKGALDCTIIARVKTAVYRACEVNTLGGAING